SRARYCSHKQSAALAQDWAGTASMGNSMARRECAPLVAASRDSGTRFGSDGNRLVKRRQRRYDRAACIYGRAIYVGNSYDKFMADCIRNLSDTNNDYALYSHCIQVPNSVFTEPSRTVAARPLAVALRDWRSRGFQLANVSTFRRMVSECPPRKIELDFSRTR